MKAQISRDSHQPSKRYGGVFQQQGRMVTDADWNELVTIVNRRQQEALRTTVGGGTPRDSGAVHISQTRTAPGDLQATGEVRWGSVVVDGLYAEVAGDSNAGGVFDYAKQRDFPSPPTLPTGQAHGLYVDVWERLVIAPQDPNLMDPALRGADTCVRTEVLAQVKFTGDLTSVTNADLNPSRGDARFDLVPVSVDPTLDVCSQDSTSAIELGSHLFRLEVHSVLGNAHNPTEVVLKWSRENGAEAYATTSVPPDFVVGDWVFEEFDDTTERHLGVHLNSGAVEHGVLTRAYPSPPSKQYVRRWDGMCTLSRNTNGWSLVSGEHRGTALPPGALSSGVLDLDLDVLQMTLQLQGRRFVAGDFWYALVRPQGDIRILSPEPVGIHHHYLALLAFDASGAPIAPDINAMRSLDFPPLSDLTADSVGYDPSVTTSRWEHITEGAVPPPETVQDAIDLLAGELDASDIAYVKPSCAGVTTLSALLGTVPAWPDLDGDGLESVKDVLDALVCHLDASRVPYSTSATGTVKEYLDKLRADVDARVKIAGDTMTGDLVMDGAAIRIGTAHQGGMLSVEGGAESSLGGATQVAIEVNHHGDGTVVLQGNGGAGVFRLAIQDGHGRVSQTWNAQDSGGDHLYDRDGEGALWLRFHEGTFSVRSAARGQAGDVIGWSQGYHQLEDGRVGIGTTSPTDKLHIDGGALRPASGDAEDSGILFRSLGGETGFVRFYGPAQHESLVLGATGAGAIVMQTKSGVAINTPSPATGAALDVNGRARMQSLEMPGGGAGKLLTSDAQGVGSWQDPVDHRIPSGAVMAFATDDPPTGWLVCDGRWHKRTQVTQALYERVSDDLKLPPNHSLHADYFRVPDLRGRFVRGYDGTRAVGTRESDQLQNHTHRFTGFTGVTGNADLEIQGQPLFFGSPALQTGNYHAPVPIGHGHTFTPAGTVGIPTSGRSGFETRPRNTTLRYCIKL